MSHLLEADDSGSLTIPADILGHPEPHARFMVQSEGRSIHIEPEIVDAESPQVSHRKVRSQVSVRGEEWKALAEEIGRKWATDKSAAEVISEMRR